MAKKNKGRGRGGGDKPDSGSQGSQQLQGGTPGHQQGQGGPPGHQQAQGGPSGHQQAQGGPPGHQQQRQGGPPGQQQRQGGPPGHHQAQGGPPGLQQQREGGPSGHQQAQGGPPGRQQQRQGGPPGQQQRQGGPSGHHQAQGGPPGLQQAQGGPSGHQQAQRGGPSGHQQAQGGPPGHQQAQGGPPGHQQQRQGGPPGQQQRQGGPSGHQQAQGGPPGHQQQRQGGPPGQQQRQGGPSGHHQAQGGPPGHQQQRQGGPSGHHQAQGVPPGHQQAQGGPPGHQQQRQGGPPGQQQRQGGPSGHHQAQGGPPGHQRHDNAPGPQYGDSGASSLQRGRGGAPESAVAPVGQPEVQLGKHTPVVQPPKQKDFVSRDMSALTVHEPVFKIPTKAEKAKFNKGGVQRGKPISLEVNHLLVKWNPPSSASDYIHHYDVAIDPDKPKRLIRPAFEELRSTLFPKYYPAFDGKRNMYSRGPLPLPNNEVCKSINVADDERNDRAPKTFKFTIKLVRQNLDLNALLEYQKGGASTSPPQDVIQALDVVLRSASVRNGFVQVGRSFFVKPNNIIDLGHGLDLWLGFFQSFILGQRPYLNIDVAHKGFPRSINLVNLVHEMADARSPQDVVKYLESSSENFVKFIKGLKVSYEIPGIESSKRIYRVNNVVGNALNERFDHNGTHITIGEYFEKEKHYRIRNPHLPCVHVGAREKTIYVPMELCTIVEGQATMKKMDEKQTASMVRAAATNVADRKAKIRDAMMKANINVSKEVCQFGLSVAQEFAKVTGRILPAPQLQYQRKTVNPFKGVWRSGNFVTGVQLKKWVIVDATGRLRADDAYNMEKNMITEGRSLGMEIGNMQEFIVLRRQWNAQQMNNSLQKTFQNLLMEQVQLAVVVIGSRDSQIYSLVKIAAEIHTGILTQCVQDFTVQRKMNQSTVHNILLKVNSKLNGVNHLLAGEPIFKDPQCKVLVIGADVTHPSPDSRDIPSVAAVTASHDVGGFQYNPQIRLQPPRVEIIEDLENIVHTQLLFFRERTGAIPKHIIFYRDGVSEGQFQQVLDRELTAIRNACKRCNENYRPKTTFLVVQKRHHTRFFPMNPKDSEDRNGNVPAGTIVDTDICHPTEIDFYLVSHASIQGVARPTKYHVLWDDSELSEDQIKLLTYGLCHLFTRCDRAVSYPAPTYYAHLAAARGRVYLENMRVNLDNLRQEESKIRNIIFKQNPMFFV